MQDTDPVFNCLQEISVNGNAGLASISLACKVKKIGVAMPGFCANDADVFMLSPMAKNR
jgi:hypothetical protein